MNPLPLIVNADDLGLTIDVNEGIFTAIDEGLVTDTSILICGRAAEHAVSGLKHRAIQGVGLHVCLVDEEHPIAPASRLGPLAEDGQFLLRAAFLARLATSRTAMLKAVALEVEAQFARACEAGLEITHVDSHQHIHLLPGISEIVLDACCRHRVPFVRATTTRVRSPEAVAVAVLGNRLRRRARRAGVVPFPSLGFEWSGRLTPHAFAVYLRRAREIGAEIMVHPGRGNTDSLERYHHWHYDWDREMRALREGAGGHRVTGVTYRQAIRAIVG